MGKFLETARDFVNALRRKQNTTYDEVLDLSLNSVKYGSALTGAPGQPIGPDEPAGKPHLRESIQIVEVRPNVKKIEAVGEPKAWVKQNEDGIARPGGGPYRLLSPVGGRWSFQKTRNGAANIIAEAKRRASR